MLLTQNPQPINFSRHHRRHPASLSSIAVVAHPTSTPGLLSLSKPVRPTSRHPQRPHSPRFPRNRFHRSTTSISVPSPAVSTPDSARGRSHQPSKAQSAQPRSPSQVHPPNTPPSAPPESATPVAPKEDPSLEPTTLVSHPTGRLARSRRSRHRSTPAIAKSSISPERGKGTRAQSPSKKYELSAPIPVPERRSEESQALPHKILSRSDPLSKLTIHTNLSTPLKAARRDKRHRSKVERKSDGAHLPLAEWDFPAPGSSSDEGEGEEGEPVTPTGQTGRNHKSWQTVFQEGPKTAPLPPSVPEGQSSFFTFPPRANPAGPRSKTPPNVVPGPTAPSRQPRLEHRRVPSQPASFSRGGAVEAVFHWSEDEADVLPVGADVHEKMALLFGNGNTSGTGSPLFPNTGTPNPSPRKHKAPRDRER